MHNQLKIALIVEAIVLVVALVFSVVFFQMGLYKSSRSLEVLLVVAWVLVAAVLLLVYRARLNERDKLVRRFYLSHEWIYNHEIGYAPMAQIVPDRDPYEFVSFAAEALAKMSYGFEVAEAPSNFTPKYLITSSQFRFHLVGEGNDPDEKSVVIDRWRGTLHRIESTSTDVRSDSIIGTYSNARQLAMLLGANDVLTMPSDCFAPINLHPQAGSAADLDSLLTNTTYETLSPDVTGSLAGLDSLLANDALERAEKRKTSNV